LKMMRTTMEDNIKEILGKLVRDRMFETKLTFKMKYPYPVINTESAYSNISNKLIEAICKFFGEEKFKELVKSHYESDGSHFCCWDCANRNFFLELYKCVSFCNVNRSSMRFSKQLSLEIKQKTGIDVRPIQETIGNVLNEFHVKNSSQDELAYYDIVDDFSWKDGMFGKSGSCWWTCYSRSRDTLKHYGGFCIRFYKSHEDSKGTGRTWIYPLPDYPGALVLFNSYGEYDLSAVRNLLYKVLKISNSKKVECYNQRNGDMPFVNDRTAMLMWKGEFLKYAGTVLVDLNMRVQSGIYSFYCNSCGDWFNSREQMYSEERCQRCHNNGY
jgi:hypothetical protein